MPTISLTAVVVLVSVVSLSSIRLGAQRSEDPDVMQLRSRIADAAKRKDRAALEPLFTADFTHTHAVGRLDDRAARLRAMVSGDTTIEMVPPQEMTVRRYGADTAVAVGRSSIGSDTYRWTAVYVREGSVWRAAASHASRVE